MADSSNERSGGFDRPRPAGDPYITAIYQQLELGDSPSLAAIEPHAVGMMREGRVLEGMGLVLGRRIDAKDAQADPRGLGALGLLGLQQPEQAFGLLLLKLEADESKTQQ